MKNFIKSINPIFGFRVVRKTFEDKVKRDKENWGEEWVFQYDNDMKLKSKLESDFRKKNNIISLEWPPYSQDLNPIENIWALWHQKLMHKILVLRVILLKQLRRLRIKLMTKSLKIE